MKYSHALKTGFVGLLGLAASLSMASSTIWANQTILSSVRDDSNLDGGITGYDFNLTTDAGDADLYVNSINIVGGMTWDPNIDFSVNMAGTSYVLGTAIGEGSFVTFNDLAVRYNAVNPLVNIGVYDFSVDFVGGVDGSAMDVIASVQLQLEVFEKYEYTLTAMTTPGVIPQGGQSTVSMVLQNNMATRDLVTTTWYVGGGGFSNGTEQLSFDGFAGNWFSQVLAPGGTYGSDHSVWGASVSQTLGVYDGTNATGLVGGLYDGDFFYLPSNGTTIEVVSSVPEPASILALACGLVAFARKRRKVA